MLFVICIFVAVLSGAFITFGNMADGCATDSIARVSYGGWVWKTWRVELTNDHPISDGSGGVIAQRYGAVNDPELLKRLQEYADSGERVRVCYHSELFVYNWEYSDAEVIYSVNTVGG
ncbi:MAG: hypothetical protein PHS46_08240 [Candidatus Omnitrophica bacterium]|nr:hypothetical protein [Candidatus Omnitrophota bacterium]